MKLVEINGLTKVFALSSKQRKINKTTEKEKIAVKDLSLYINEGEEVMSMTCFIPLDYEDISLSSKNGKKVKILYGQQVSTCPPTFNIYCNHAELIENSYLRYLENSFRRAFDFKGTPIKIQFKNKNED